MKLVHCSYHKCLTVYYSRVMSTLYNQMFRLRRGYKHFKSSKYNFYQGLDTYKIASINNHAIDLQRLGNEFRISRFIRDPRDLVVSGYFYHKRGAETWSTIVNPPENAWNVFNGCMPKDMGEGNSYASYLQGMNKEDGLIAEIDFRIKHFDSMMDWPVNDSRIRVYKYEDLIGNEKEVFSDILGFYGAAWPEKILGQMLADKFSAKKQKGKTQHIRNASSSQWKDHFSPRVEKYFEEKHGELLERYDYA